MAKLNINGKIRDTLDADPTVGAGGPLTDTAGHGTHVASFACAVPQLVQYIYGRTPSGYCTNEPLAKTMSRSKGTVRSLL